MLTYPDKHRDKLLSPGAPGAHHRALYCGLASLLLLALGCTAQQPSGTPVELAWEKPAATPTSQPAKGTVPISQPDAKSGQSPASAPAPADIIASINGTPVTRTFLNQELLHSHGLGLMEQMVLLIAARQRAAEMSLTVSEADVAAAHEDALRRLAAPIGTTDELPLDRPAAERLLDEFLLAKNVSRAEWNRRMEQQACLHKIAAAEVQKMDVTEGMLRDEYALQYGERVQIRHIQSSSLSAIGSIRDELAKGTDFELVARRRSENQITAARGGLLPPFTRKDPGITPLIRETAFSLSVGQVSPVITENNWYHIIRLERRFPASGVGFENVDKAALKQHLQDRLTRERQDSLEAELFKRAAVDIRDPDLARQFRERHRRSK